MVDVAILGQESSGTPLDFGEKSPAPAPEMRITPESANGSAERERDKRRPIVWLRELMDSVVSTDPPVRELEPAILEEIKSNGWLTAYSAQIDLLSRLPIDWDSYGSNPPNVVAARTAREILDSLWRIDMPPSRVAPLADEGIIIWLMLNNRRISIESLNSGTTVMEINKSDGSLEKVYENKTPTEIADILDFVFPQTEIAATTNVPSKETGGSELPTE